MPPERGRITVLVRTKRMSPSLAACQSLAPIPIRSRVDEGGPSTLKEMPQHVVWRVPRFLLITRKERTSTKLALNIKRRIKFIMCEILELKREGVLAPHVIHGVSICDWLIKSFIMWRDKRKSCITVILW